MSSWHQDHVRNRHLGNGFWAIDVTRPGRYEFELRRWPDHTDRPIEAKHARLKIGQADLNHPVDPTHKKTTFTVDLPAGHTRLQTWLTTENNKTHGAYFVYVSRVK